MTIDTASAVEVQHPLRGSNEHDQALLVITDDRHHGHDSLSTPFAEAVVLEVGPDPDEVVIEGLFDTIVIERSNVDPQWLGAVNSRVQAALRPDGQLLVALDPVGQAADAETATVALAGLQWHGLRAFSGSPCAVLRRGAPETAAVATGALLATAEAAVRLTTAGAAHSTTRITLGEARAVVGQYLEDQRRSEHALLKHLDTLASELEKERAARKQDQTLKGVLRMTPQGRKALGAARKARNFARKVKRKVKRTLRHQ